MRKITDADRRAVMLRAHELHRAAIAARAKLGMSVAGRWLFGNCLRTAWQEAKSELAMAQWAANRAAASVAQIEADNAIRSIESRTDFLSAARAA